MWEILLASVLLETAGHLILRRPVKAILNVSTLIVLTAIRMVHFLHAPSWRGERMRINLRVVASNSVGSLDHIESTIRLANFFHFLY